MPIRAADSALSCMRSAVNTQAIACSVSGERNQASLGKRQTFWEKANYKSSLVRPACLSIESKVPLGRSLE